MANLLKEWTNERESICNKKKIEVLKNFDEAQRTLENFQDLEMVYNQTKDRQRNENYEKNLLRIEIEGMTEKIVIIDLNSKKEIEYLMLFNFPRRTMISLNWIENWRKFHSKGMPQHLL